MGDLGSALFTLDEALGTIGTGKFNVVALLFAGIGFASISVEMMIQSLIGPVVQSEWGLSSSEESMLATLIFAGMFVGAYFFGFVSDAYGRRTSTIGSTMSTLGAGILSALSPSYKWLLILRCLLGFGVGGGHVFISWFLEFAPTSSRGAWTVSLSVFYAIGSILGNALAWIIMPRFGWRWLNTISCILPLLALVFGAFVPESPRYLCMKGRTSEAYKVLQKIATMNKREVPNGTLVFIPSVKQDEENISTDRTPLLSIKEKTGDSESTLRAVIQLFSPKLLKITLLVWLLQFFSMFSYFGIVYLTTKLSTHQNYCQPSEISPESTQENASYKEVFITSLAELPSAFFAAIIVDRVGRKLNIGIISVFVFFLLLPLMWPQSDIVITTLLFGSRFFITAEMSVVSVYISEVYPTAVRSTGAGITNCIGYIGAMVCPVVAVVLIEGCHQEAAITLFEVAIVLICVSVFFIPLETKGRILSDVVQNDEESSDHYVRSKN
ncbi:secondary carrier transporter [Lithospermum erythrorhizon]|uniref:Secondary carrier transporter n=1 Tax=Lithospermum erythrorhizon TaxID=34254 RepID=A0AAV3PR73_LITER